MSYKAAYKTHEKSYSKNAQRDIPTKAFFDNRIENETADEKRIWLDTKKASAYLGISPNALRILVHRGKIEAYKLGSHLRFTPGTLQALLKRKEY